MTSSAASATLFGNRSTSSFAWRLWGSWVLANALGELIGLGTIAVIGLAAAPALGQATSVAAVLGVAMLAILLGAGEGAVVGIAQGMVLRTALPALRLRSWILATAAGAALAWFLGMTPSTAVQLAGDPGTPPAFEPRGWVQAGLAAALGCAAGLILALPQWRVLRRHVSRGSWWLVANVAAWMAAMPVIFAAADLISSDASDLQILATLLGAIVLAGAVAGAIHGAFLIALLRPNRHNINPGEAER